ncbi:GNAT family N-acetyltransferase [Galactobacter valiniphilus]|uniref:GNAT family N-acetyltransferase n=1 Tax=Galactobacter valiniphilus TaxID=2676122 RepID=UPI0037367B68
MVRIPSPAALWSRSTRSARHDDAASDGVRLLTQADTAAVRALVAEDPVAHAFVDSQLAITGTVASRSAALYLGRFDEHERLVAACWVGSNVVPVGSDEESGAAFGRALLKQRRRFASVFGPADAVRGIWSELAHGRQRAFDIREHQPLMVMSAPPADQLRAHAVRKAWPHDYDRLLPACAAMFEEELGYSPLTQGEAQYRARVDWLIRAGHALVETDPSGRIVFKAELGVVTPHATQIQGVWMNPDFRGLGLAASRMADVTALALEIAPTVSLYVNDYNTRALSTYERVGFEQVGEFATVLF